MIIDLNLKGKGVLVIGGGNEAARKVEALLTQDCNIFVVAEKVEKSIKQHADAGKIKIDLHKIDDIKFLNNYKDLILIIATTDNRELNRKIVLYGKSCGLYVYAADDPEISDFIHPSVINIKDIFQVAISTGGKSPLMGKVLREKIEPIINDSISDLFLDQINLQFRLRIKAKNFIPTASNRKKFLMELLSDDEVNKLLEEKKLFKAEIKANERLDNYVLSSNKISN